MEHDGLHAVHLDHLGRLGDPRSDCKSKSGHSIFLNCRLKSAAFDGDARQLMQGPEALLAMLERTALRGCLAELAKATVGPPLSPL